MINSKKQDELCSSPKGIPTYNQLVKEAAELKENPDLSKMSTIINSLSQPKMNDVMALVYHHAILKGDYISGKTPYNGKIFDGTKGVRYQLKDLPPELLKILWIFINGPNFK